MSRGERIAARLIAALESLIPAYCILSIYAGRLDVAIEGRVEVSMDLNLDERVPDRDAVLAFNVLSTIQDAIVRTSTEPWPPASEPTYLPYPAATVREGLLVAWFGSESHPTVAIPPIDLATV